MTSRMKMISDAQAKGFEVRANVLGRFHKGNGKCLLGVVICEDGSYYRADVDLSLTNKMTTRDARTLFGI